MSAVDATATGATGVSTSEDHSAGEKEVDEGIRKGQEKIIIAEHKDEETFAVSEKTKAQNSEYSSASAK